MAKVYNFMVTGRGQFPFDMLRYDQAWPTYESEIGLLTPSREEMREPRSINISSHSTPNDARWQSFGWTVSKTFVG